MVRDERRTTGAILQFLDDLAKQAHVPEMLENFQSR